MATARQKDAVEKVLSKQAISMAEPGRSRKRETAG
jgi:hypothetical protein